MARSVNTKRGVELHQALHGYADGHRQLAISTKLEPSDSKLLLTFSDISGPGGKPDSEGYLTGYPLSGSGLFALSRTWLALEMPRPGCVWTHTLLVRLADLAIIDSFEELSKNFRYPDNRYELENYNAPLEIFLSDYSTGPVQIPEMGALLLKELYSSPHRRVLVERPEVFSDEIVLAVWSQQWPRLRRAFSFCSLSTRDRSSNGIEFDLQLVPRKFFSVARQAEDTREDYVCSPIHEDWLLRALRDLERPNDDGLRSFLKLVGSDVEGGREAFRPLCTLFTELKEGYGGQTMLRRALVTLEEEPSLSTARTARGVVANAVTANVNNVDDVELSFLWKNIEHVDKELLSKCGTNIVQALWRRKPEGFEKGSWHNATQRGLIDGAIESTELSELLCHLIDAPELENVALRLRPAIMQEALYWRNATELERSINVAAGSPSRDKSLEAMIMARRKELPGLAVSSFGEKDVLSVIESLISSNLDTAIIQPWMIEATHDPSGIANFLRDSQELDLTFLTMIAGCVSEDLIPDIEGEDPWLIALRNAGALGSGDPLDLRLAVVVLSRALGGTSRSPGGLVRAGFESVDNAVADHRLPEELWQKLERHLPRSIFWFDWGRTHRIRSAVVDVFAKGRLPAEEFVQVTQDSGVFKDLVRQMSLSRAGRSYLEEVVRYLNSGEKLSSTK